LTLIYISARTTGRGVLILQLARETVVTAQKLAGRVKFLSWVGEQHRLLARVSVKDVDEFLAMKGAAGWNRKSVSVAAQALRAFFRYARDPRLVRCRLRQGHPSTKNLSI